MIPGADRKLYQAIYGDGVIRVIDANGETLEKIQPGMNPTNVTVDPSGKLGLVVTETEKGLLSYGRSPAWRSSTVGMRDCRQERESE
jgi:gluconolactonase